MNINILKQKLKQSTTEQLIKDIVDIYKKNNFVKDYYNSKYSKKDDISILNKHKDIIENEFFPIIGFGKARLSVAKKAISEYKKINNKEDHIAELMIFYVENGVQYSECYGDIYEQFYLSMESMYKKAIKFIIDNNLQNKYKKRCLSIIKNTKDMGWGFHDELCNIYYSYFFDNN